jgi:hypothetical protein
MRRARLRRIFILITGASDEKAVDHGDRSTSPDVASAPADARRRLIVAGHVDAEAKPGSIGASLRARWEGVPLVSVSSGRRMRRHQPRCLERWMGRVVSATGISSVPPGRSRDFHPPARTSAGFDQRSRSLRRRGPDDVVGARKGHGLVRLTGRRGERRLARVAPAGEGRTG